MRTVVAHTADLGERRLGALREFLFDTFRERYGDGFDEHDWRHALGGMHALALDGDAIAGHGSIVPRLLRADGTWVRAGYVESVAVSAKHRRRGVGGTLMAELERIARDGFEVGALAASPDGAPLYEARGWTRWRGPLSELRPEGVVPTTEDHWIFVLGGTLDPDGELTCDWREGSIW